MKNTLPILLLSALVLVGVGYAVMQLRGKDEPRAKPRPKIDAASQLVPDKGKPPAPASQRTKKAPVEPGVSGTILDPDGLPVRNAQVRLLRALTTWPEMAEEELESLRSGEDGRFAFETARGPDLWLEVHGPTRFLPRGGRNPRQQEREQGAEPPERARGMLARTRMPAPPQVRELVVRMTHGFNIIGVVRGPEGAALADCEVVMDEGLFATAKAETTRTNRLGQFVFPGVSAGIVRLSARDKRYKPVTLPSVAVGEQRRLSLAFKEPAWSLNGTVTRSGGQPVEGARVRAFAASMQSGNAALHETRTDARGAFTLLGLGEGNVRVEVSHADWSTTKRPVAMAPNVPPLQIELVAKVPLAGRLTGEGAGLELRFSGDDGHHARTRAAADGRFAFASRVSLGSAVLDLLDEQHYFEKTTTRRLDLRVDETIGDRLELAVARGLALTGTVLDDTGKPLPDARISVAREKHGVHAIWETVAISDARGCYEIRGLPPRAVQTEVSHDGYALARTSLLGPEPGKSAEAKPLQLARSGVIFGRVKRNQRPCQGALVFISQGVMPSVYAVSGPDGSFTLRDLPPGEHQLKARYSTMKLGLSQEAVKLEAGGNVGPIEIEVPAGRVIKGVIVDSSDRPVADAAVNVLGLPSNPTVVNSDGTFELELPEGEVTLVAATVDMQYFTPETVGARDREVRILLPTVPAGSLTATVRGLPNKQLVPGGILRVEPTDLFGTVPNPFRKDRVIQSRWFDVEGGVMRLDRFPAGRSRLTLHCSGFAPFVKEVSVDPHGQVDLGEILLEPGAKVRGRIVDPEGKAVVGAQVLLGIEADLPQVRGKAGTTTDTRGEFELSGVGPHATSIVITSPDLATRVRVLELPQDLLRDTPLSIEMTRGSSIVVKVEKADGSRETAGAVMLFKDGVMLEGRTLREDAEVVFDRRVPGAYEVSYFEKVAKRLPVVIEEDGQKVEIVVRRAKK